MIERFLRATAKGLRYTHAFEAQTETILPPPDKIYDYTLIRKITAELDASGWKPVAWCRTKHPVGGENGIA